MSTLRTVRSRSRFTWSKSQIWTNFNLDLTVESKSIPKKQPSHLELRTCSISRSRSRSTFKSDSTVQTECPHQWNLSQSIKAYRSRYRSRSRYLGL